METIYQDYRLRLMRSSSDSPELFALIGHYLTSPRVRRECGGYALNDGPFYRWLIAQKQDGARAAAFLSFEVKENSMVLHHGYVAPVHRAHGLFREMLNRFSKTPTARHCQYTPELLQPVFRTWKNLGSKSPAIAVNGTNSHER
jgi:hypothetical protein